MFHFIALDTPAYSIFRVTLLWSQDHREQTKRLPLPACSIQNEQIAEFLILAAERMKYVQNKLTYRLKCMKSNNKIA